MSFSVGIAALLVASLFGICLCQTYNGTSTGSGNGTGNGTDIQVFMQIKNCSQEAIYYTAEGLTYECVFFNKSICFTNYEKCINARGYNTTKAKAICQTELGSNFLNLTNADCVTPPSQYLSSLQSICCTKTKLMEQVPSNSFFETQKILQSCYDRANCGPGNIDLCNAGGKNVV